MEQTKEELWAVAAQYCKLKSEGKNPIAQYYYPDNNKWYEHEDHHGFNMPDFDSGDIWRLKSETIKHRGGEYPKPCTDADVDEILKARVIYEPYYRVEANGRFSPAYKKVTIHSEHDRNSLHCYTKLGLYYLKREDAIDRAKVIYEID